MPPAAQMFEMKITVTVRGREQAVETASAIR
jgi:hypothetical protein